LLTLYQSHTEKVPRSQAEEISLDEYIVVFQDMFNVLRVIDDNSCRKRWDRYLERAESNLALSLGEPIQELVPGLKEPYAVAGKRKGSRWSTIAAN